MLSLILTSAISGFVVFALAGLIVVTVTLLPFVCAWSVLPGAIVAGLVFLRGIGQ